MSEGFDLLPVSHSASVFAEFTNPITPEQFRSYLKDQAGVVVEDDLPNGVYPRPFEAAGKDPVFAGRIRRICRQCASDCRIDD